MTGPVGAAILRGTDSIGVLGLALLPGAPRRVLGRRPFTNPESLRGARIRIIDSATTAAAVRALDAIPKVYLDDSDVSPALAAGRPRRGRELGRVHPAKQLSGFRALPGRQRGALPEDGHDRDQPPRIPTSCVRTAAGAAGGRGCNPSRLTRLGPDDRRRRPRAALPDGRSRHPRDSCRPRRAARRGGARLSNVTRRSGRGEAPSRGRAAEGRDPERRNADAGNVRGGADHRKPERGADNPGREIRHHSHGEGLPSLPRERRAAKRRRGRRRYEAVISGKS